MAPPTHKELAQAYEACVAGTDHPHAAVQDGVLYVRGPKRPEKPVKDFEIKVEKRLQTGVATTKAAMAGWMDNRGRTNQAKAFLKRAAKSDRRRKLEKASRKRNRK